jgi:hypothetical protein
LRFPVYHVPAPHTDISADETIMLLVQLKILWLI